MWQGERVWISELSARSGTPLPTIKYYLREGLLPPGESLSATRSRYDESHVRRLRLIRSLVTVAGLSLEQVGEIIGVVEDEAISVAQAIGHAHAMLSRPPSVEPSEAARARVSDLLEARGWQTVAPSHALALAAAIDDLAAAGQPLRDDSLEIYADAVTQIAQADLNALGTARSSTDAIAYAVTGTLLVEPVLIALRRMAQDALTRQSPLTG